MMSRFHFHRTGGLVSAALLVASVTAAQAQDLQVSKPWARPTVAGQKAGGAFMQLSSAKGTTVVGGRSPAAGLVEIHEMKMDGEVMRMRALASLDVPAGKPVELKPGGLHVMLMDLKAPLTKGSTVPLTLITKDAAGKTHTVDLKVPVDSLAPAGASSGGGHAHH